MHSLVPFLTAMGRSRSRLSVESVEVSPGCVCKGGSNLTMGRSRSRLSVELVEVSPGCVCKLILL